MKTKTNQNNCLLIYGGGLCDSANFMMRTWAEALATTGKFDKVYIGFNSFAATQNPALIEEWTPEIRAGAEANYGGFFGTSRNVMMTDPIVRDRAINTLHDKGISFVGCIGGDGSSRCLAAIADAFLAEGILWAFLMPATIDGIEGGKSFGLKAAVRTSCYIIEQLVSTCLNTLNVTEAPVLVVELQGRNRDDIIANVLQKIDQKTLNFGRTPLKVGAITANYPVNFKSLMELRERKEPLLILLSEGALFSKSEIKTLFHGKKVRTFEVAHLSQMNGATSDEDRAEIKRAVEIATRVLPNLIDIGMPFAFVFDADVEEVCVETIDYYANKNPSENQHPTLGNELEDIVRSYII